MTVKQLIRELRHPPSNRVAFVRIEFADGSIYEISPDMRRNSIANRRFKKDAARLDESRLLAECRPSWSQWLIWLTGNKLVDA